MHHGLIYPLLLAAELERGRERAAPFTSLEVVPHPGDDQPAVRRGARGPVAIAAAGRAAWNRVSSRAARPAVRSTRP